jgi:integrase
MPKALPLYVEKNPNRHGRLRFYFRRSRGEERVRLPDAFGSPEFKAAYAACLAGLPLPAPLGQATRRPSAGKLGWLIQLYLASAEGQRGKAGSLRVRRSLLGKLAEEKGAVDLEDIDRAAIVAGLTARSDTVPMANLWLATVRLMFDWAVQEGHRTINPCDGVKRLQKPAKVDLDDEDDGRPAWSEEELALYEAAYPLGTRQRLVYEVLISTGLRLGDAARLGRQHVRDGVIRLKTEKTNTPVAQPMKKRLLEAIEAGPKGKPEVMAFITSPKGAAYEKTYLGKEFVRWARAAGVNDRSAHGVRKALANRYAEQGCSEDELKAIFGWTTSAMANLYTKKFNREKTALRAMAEEAA